MELVLRDAGYAFRQLVMIASALVASWLPARRAARIDPIHALREE
jgi:ABC-type lipoprotein release transport system permease subunit